MINVNIPTTTMATLNRTIISSDGTVAVFSGRKININIPPAPCVKSVGKNNK